MCEIRLLVVGDSEQRNLEAIHAVSEKCLDAAGSDVCLLCDKVECKSFETDVNEYDIVAIDDSVAPTECGHTMIGSDVPVVFFSDLVKNSFSAMRLSKGFISAVISNAIARGSLREKISLVTEEIEETSRMLSAI